MKIRPTKITLYQAIEKEIDLLPRALTKAQSGRTKLELLQALAMTRCARELLLTGRVQP